MIARVEILQQLLQDQGGSYSGTFLQDHLDLTTIIARSGRILQSGTFLLDHVDLTTIIARSGRILQSGTFLLDHQE